MLIEGNLELEAYKGQYLLEETIGSDGRGLYTCDQNMDSILQLADSIETFCRGKALEKCDSHNDPSVDPFGCAY